MQIRKLNKYDSSEMKNLYEVYQKAYSVEADILSVKRELFFPLSLSLADLRSSTDEILVYFDDNSIKGAIFLERLDSSITISSLVVDPLFFRSGIAKSLIRHCLNVNECAQFYVGTGLNNVPAIKLYQSFGFEITNEKIVEPKIKIVQLMKRL